MTIAALPAFTRTTLEPRLPDWVEPRWWADPAEAVAVAPGAAIGWFDMADAKDMVPAIDAATELKWLNSIYAGVDWMPIETLAARGVAVSNGAGINAVTIAEYVVMGMLTIAKGYRDVVRAQDRHEWLRTAPGRQELAGSRALIIGGGAIGSLAATRLRAFEVEVDVVRRTPGPGELGPADWQDRLPDYDWVIVAAPATAETRHMIGAMEIAAMKKTAVVVNVARGVLIDQDALATALIEQRLGGAFLDVTTPEPLPPEHPLWTIPTAHITMHLSGQSQSKMVRRSIDRFVANLDRWHRGEALEHRVDLLRGY